MHDSSQFFYEDSLELLDFSSRPPYPERLFAQLNGEQRKIFRKLLKKKKGEPIDIEKDLTGIIRPFRGIWQRNLSYTEILKKITNHFDIPTSSNDVKEVEEEILVFKFQENYERMTQEEKDKFQKELEKVLETQNLDNSQLASLGTVGALALAEISGFGLYIMASTFVGGISSLLGLGLSFSFYTGMSSFISFVTGPIGWVLGLGALAYSLRNENFESISQKFWATLKASKSMVRGNYDLAAIIVIQICAHRILLNQEKNKEIESLEADMKREKLKKEVASNKAKVIEIELRRILREKEEVRKVVDHLTRSIDEREKNINNLKNELI